MYDMKIANNCELITLDLNYGYVFCYLLLQMVFNMLIALLTVNKNLL